MPNIYEGSFDAGGLKFGIVVSRFNHFISDKLLSGAMDAIFRHGGKEEDISIYRVPGSFEIPPVANKLVESGKFDAIICLGVIIRGDTPHFDYIASEVSKGVANIAINSGIPVIFGIITADTIEQAIERAGTKHGNKGFDAAMAAIEMANLYKSIK
ncbi:MAG: 6,7-dimethyl-8-ribityllumazine synthase [Deltaproteobacteria bacterium]|nr:6,7-dimethyl-8-ribityllumazine synthase [Deltaproteobacteria bacterium]